MQIHELTKRQRIDEIDMLALGREILRDPNALISSTALGAAQQRATQAGADKDAQKLAAQGYQVGGRVKQQVTVPQMLQAVQKNPQVQRVVQNLTAQWMTQGAALVQRLATMQVPPPSGGTSAPPIANPPQPKDPKEQMLLAKFYQQQAAKGEAGATAAPPTPGAPAAPAQPDADDQALVNAKIQAFADEFVEWSDPRLNAGGVTMSELRKDPAVNKMLKDQLTGLAFDSMDDPKSAATRDRVEQYMFMAIAAIQTAVQNSQQVSPRTRTAQVGAAGGGGQSDQEILTQLQGQGLPFSRAQLETLGQVLQADSGTNTINNTGNRLLNAIARLAGLRIAG